MKSFALALLLLLGNYKAFCQPTAAPRKTPPASICISPRQAQVINDSLYRFQEVKRAYRNLKAVSADKSSALLDQQQATMEARSAADDYRQANELQKVLTADAEAHSNKWKLKARKRFWVIVLETAAILGVTTLAITR